MQCEEVRSQLVDLVYDELDVAPAADCQAHLAECDSCRAEFDALRKTQSLLDTVGKQQSQVDVAEVCLRLVRTQQHRQATWRWVAGIAAVAAGVLVLAGSRWLHVNLEPGRMVVAWRASPTVEAAQPDSPVPADPRVPPSNEMSASPAQIAGRIRAGVPSLVRGGDSQTLALLVETDGLRDWAPRRQMWQLHEGPLAVDAVIPRRSAASEPAPSQSYTELRRQMMGDDAPSVENVRSRGG